MPDERVRATECQLATCRASRRRRVQTRDEVVLSAPATAASRRGWLSDVPQVKNPVPARRYFPQDLLRGETSKKLVRPIDLRLPCLQPEGYERAVVSHASISCQPLMGVEPRRSPRRRC